MESISDLEKQWENTGSCWNMTWHTCNQCGWLNAPKTFFKKFETTTTFESLAPRQGYLLGTPLHVTCYAQRHRPLLKIALTCHPLLAGGFDPNWKGCRCKCPNLRLQKQWEKLLTIVPPGCFFGKQNQIRLIEHLTSVGWKLLTFTIWQSQMIFSQYVLELPVQLLLASIQLT